MHTESLLAQIAARREATVPHGKWQRGCRHPCCLERAERYEREQDELLDKFWQEWGKTHKLS